MAKVQDPVCGMTIDSESAAATSQYEGRTVYFCATSCKEKFDADPSRYAAALPVEKSADTLERHEPNFTKKDGMVSPKFGSAGSGGAEYERLPEAHERGKDA